jgi:hypothetical protein
MMYKATVTVTATQNTYEYIQCDYQVEFSMLTV